MAWLSDWAKRIKGTVKTTNVDADLTHFPVCVFLNNSAGVSDDDITAIFDEVGANSLKIAFTKDDGETQLYAEIEKWDNVNESAVIWLSKSDWVVDGDADTDFYLYFDSTKDDNTTYIGNDADDAASNAVWNSGFLAVYHMNDTDSTCKDSTGNSDDGTYAGSLPDTARAGQTGLAQDLDGTGDFVNISIAASANITRECWFYPDSLANYQGLLSRGGSAWADNVCHIKGEGTNAITFDINIGGVSTKRTWSTTTGGWRYVACTYNSTSGLQVIYGNGASQDSATVTSGKTPAAVDYIGNEYDGARDADGIIDEVRFSNTDRSAAWVKATYYTNTDALIEWDSVEEISWYNSSWLYRVKITVLATKVDADLEDYPVYVDLSDLPAGFHTNVNSTDARDIRVTEADGTTEVPREVVFYTAASDTGELHFKGDVDSDTDTDFYIYYGNSGASEPAADATYGRENVWNSNYKAVYHLQEAVNTDAGGYVDSTSNDMDGTGVSMALDAVDGQLAGKAQDFDGSADYIQMGDVLDLGTNDMTISAWTYLDVKTASGYFCSKAKAAAANFRYGTRTVITTGTFGAFMQGDGGADVVVSGTTDVTGGWHFAHIVFDRSANITVYTDAGDAQTGSISSWDGKDFQSDNPFRIGSYTASDNTSIYAPFNGKIDEFRIMWTALSSTWISTEYNNQSSPSTFYDVGSQETNDVSVVKDFISSGIIAFPR